MPRNLRLRLADFTLAMLIAAMATVTAVQGFLTYRRVHQRIQDGFDRKLLAISTVTAAFIDGDDHRRIMEQKDEQSPLYQRYYAPMRRIQEAKDVTYLYTQVPLGGDAIVYGVDATIGKDHSPLGSRDVAPADEVDGILAVYRQGGSYLSGLRVWQEWGLLKSAFVPVRARDGAITAMVGADVNISIIKPKTLVALLLVSACGLLFLALASYISARVVRLVTEPISRLKGAALQVAAGRYGLQAAIDRPLELAAVGGSFDRLSNSLEERLQEIRQINQTIEGQRRVHLLNQALRRRDLLTGLPSASLRLLLLPAAAGCRDASGWVRWQNQLLLWAGPVEPTPLAAARTRHDLALILHALLHRLGADWTALAARLETLFADRVDGYLIVDLERDECLWLPRRAPAPRLSGADAALPAGRVQSLPADRLFWWCSRAELDARCAGLEFPADVATDPAARLDRLTARLADAADAGPHALAFLWCTGRLGHPVEAVRTLVQRQDLAPTHFAGLTAAELDLLLAATRLDTRSTDDRLTLQGEPAEMLYLLLDGRVRVATLAGPVELAGPLWLGEFGVLYGGAANATITALTPLRCLVWDRAALALLLSEHPELERKFRAVLARAMAAKLPSPADTP